MWHNIQRWYRAELVSNNYKYSTIDHVRTRKRALSHILSSLLFFKKSRRSDGRVMASILLAPVPCAMRHIDLKRWWWHIDLKTAGDDAFAPEKLMARRLAGNKKKEGWSPCGAHSVRTPMPSGPCWSVRSRHTTGISTSLRPAARLLFLCCWRKFK